MNKILKYICNSLNITQNTTKCNKGITLVALIVTIIVMLIIATTTIYIGKENIDNSRMVSFVAYMQTIQAKVDFIVEYDDYTKYGNTLTDSNKSVLQNILNSDNESFATTVDSTYLRYFDSNNIKNDLEIDNIDDEIVIDFNTREVISLNGVKYEGNTYYSQYYLPDGQALKQQTEEMNRVVEIGDIICNIDGLNATFTIKNITITNGTLSYGNMNKNNEIIWTTITNYTKNGEDVTSKNISTSGKYYFKLVDNTTGEDNADSEGNYPLVELRLANTPKLQGNLTDLSTNYNYSNLNDSSKWAFATDTTNSANLVYYVWIPRFAYKVNASGKLEELHFIRGTSDETTSGEYIKTSEWTIPEVFTKNEIQKTGVWVKVNSPNQTRNRYC